MFEKITNSNSSTRTHSPLQMEQKPSTIDLKNSLKFFTETRDVLRGGNNFQNGILSMVKCFVIRKKAVFSFQN